MIGDRIFLARQACGMTQAQLADESGLQESAICHFEKGRRKPSLDNLRRIVRATRIEADYFLETRAIDLR